jgi:hypothetical protein
LSRDFRVYTLRIYVLGPRTYRGRYNWDIIDDGTFIGRYLPLIEVLRCMFTRGRTNVQLVGDILGRYILVVERVGNFILFLSHLATVVHAIILLPYHTIVSGNDRVLERLYNISRITV